MKISKNDPRLLAYVLNELQNEDKLLIDQAIAESPELKNEISMLKNTVGFIKSQRDSESYRLNPEQREKILNLAKPHPTFLDRYWKISAALVTASLALVIFTKNQSSLIANKLEKPVPQFDSAISNSGNATAVAKSAEQASEKKTRLSPNLTNSNTAIAPTGQTLAAPTANRAAEAIQAPASSEKIQPTLEARKKDSKPSENFEAELADTARQEQKNEDSISNFAGGGAGVAADESNAAERDYKTPAVAAAPKPASPAKSKMFSSVKSGANVKESFSATTTQEKINISPTLANKSNLGEQKYVYENLTAKLRTCFENNLSKYMQYNLNIRTNWKVSNTKTEVIEITELNQPEILSPELKSCISDSIVSLELSQFNQSQIETLYSFFIKFQK